MQGLGKEFSGADMMLFKSWSFMRVEICGDGSCLLTSVAHSLIQRIDSGDTSINQIVLQLGVPDQILNT